MARIAFILLTHKDPQGVIDQARRLTATGDFVSIHYDKSAPAEDFQMIHEALADNPSVVFANRRLRCGWGEWSLVAATLEALRTAERAFQHATHFYMLSGDCMPIKSAEYAHDFLDADDCDYIESFDFFDSDWIKTGIKEERLIYRHWFNERTHKKLFYASMDWQKRLGLARKTPEGLQIMIGSQWWCLRRQTVEAILKLIEEWPALLRFFRTTWIPDETFFQTLVAHLVPKTQMRTRTLTFLLFTDYGMPVTFHDDHFDLLLRQDFLFARKISAEALELRRRLGFTWQETGRDFPISAEGPRLYHFLTGRGRIGRRFAPRFWETDGSLGRSRVVHLIVCKKWHVAKRLTERIRSLTAIPAVDFVFNELDAEMPDLGGVASSLAKRERHRRALIKLLFEQYETANLVLCLDTSALGMISDFAADRAETRILFVETEFDDDYLRGHIQRIGLANDTTAPDLYTQLIPVVRGDLEHEAELLKDMGLDHFETIAADRTIERNAEALKRFLDLSPEMAQNLAATPNLFD
ncbi:DUF5928 domain-containing protein [Paracoccus seriniphilus]|uniref:DUF5928 domain-containing protein n=1 Tax=Paracoccus seriniphilus TaxID=184748 RepID=UPI0035620B8A